MIVGMKKSKCKIFWFRFDKNSQKCDFSMKSAVKPNFVLGSCPLGTERLGFGRFAGSIPHGEAKNGFRHGSTSSAKRITEEEPRRQIQLKGKL
jgi:hypothetical protein